MNWPGLQPPRYGHSRRSFWSTPIAPLLCECPQTRRLKVGTQNEDCFPALRVSTGSMFFWRREDNVAERSSTLRRAQTLCPTAGDAADAFEWPNPLDGATVGHPNAGP